MISIRIQAKEGKITDFINKDKTNITEVALILLRLKQVEQDLLNINFDSELEISSD